MNNSKELLYLTVKWSIVLQIVTGIFQVGGLFFPLEKEDLMLRDILWIETISQVIELIFYIYIATFIVSLNLDSVTPRRYFDWVLSTPIMIISTIMYMKYTDLKENNKEELENNRTLDFVKNNYINILKLVLYNAGMLFFGYLGETNVLSKFISFPIGFYFFFSTFDIIYKDYAYTTTSTLSNKILFNYMFFVWFLYGIAAFFPILLKNISYNILDLFSKNFYGLFIFYKIFTI